MLSLHTSNPRLQKLALVSLVSLLFVLTVEAVAQNPVQSSSPTCRKDDALETIRQQIVVSKTLDDPLQRITLLIRAADLLWLLDNERARAAFTDAFDVATDYAKADLSKPVKTLLMANEDQRYRVIRAIAKREPGLAKTFTNKALEQDKQAAEEFPVKDPRAAVLSGQKLLDAALKLITVDTPTALYLADRSLNYPANSELTRFLFELAKINQVGADALYERALFAYREKPMREFLYLQAYPFAFQEGGDMPVFGFYQIPSNFRPDASLQRKFVQTLIGRALAALEVPLDAGDNYNGLSGTAHILEVFMRIEPYVSRNNPDLTEPMAQAQQGIKVSLPLDTQQTLTQGHDEKTRPSATFEERMEAAEKLTDVDKRQELFTQWILNTTAEPVEVVAPAIDKVTDSNIRTILYDWLYFTRGLDAVKMKQVKDASKLAAKIGDIEPRAYLYLQIAKATLALPDSDINPRDTLELAIAEAQKSPKTIFTARTLLNAADVYRTTDLSRSLEILRYAIDATNAVQQPDFAANDQTIVKRTNGNGWRREARFYMAGLDPQAVFTSFAKIDLEGTQSQTQLFADKLLRALTTISVAEVCLQQPQRQRQKTSAKP
jgi:hypothetical protein